MEMRKRPRKARDGLRFLLLAAGLTVGLWYVPYAGVLVYPFRIFVTFIHEASHALAALVTGGQVNEIRIVADGSGITTTRGGWGLLIASAGYLGTVIYGGLLLVIGKQARHAKPVLAVTTALIALITLLLVRPILSFGFLAGSLMTVGLAAVVYFLTTRVVHFFVSFLAVESCLNALFDLKTVFLLSARTDVPTDAMNLERVTLIPAVVWALLWVAISFLILYLALRSYRTVLR